MRKKIWRNRSKEEKKGDIVIRDTSG